VSILLWTFVTCSAALAICGAAMILAATREVLIATGCGIIALTCVLIIRRFPLGPFGTTAIVASALAAAVLMLASRPEQHGTSAPLALASSASLISLNERMLDDAPLVGTGAGTFAALAPIYREIDDPQPNSLAATAAAAIAIELGKPMFLLIATTMAGYIFILLRAALQRGRDSFYPAMAGGCLITLLLLSFNNVGLFGTTTSLIAAAVIGLGTAQSKSRSAKL
jgi:hypothetical protein